MTDFETDGMSIKTYPFNQRGHRYTRGETVRAMVTGDFVNAMDLWSSCSWCGEYSYIELVDGDRVQTPTACSVPPEGITSVWRLQVPSGKLVVANDLRNVYKLPREREDSFASYNSTLGQHQVFMAMAELGCSFGYVGNTCPSLYRTAPDTYVIGNGGWSEDEEEEILIEGEALAGITTDLWAYCIADAEDWRAKGGTDERWVEFVDVTPGTYEFTHHTGETSFDRDDYSKPMIFTDIKRVEDQ